MGLNNRRRPSPRSEFKRYSDAVTKTKQWKPLRFQALRRDDFQCVKCGARSCRLEVDHIKPVRDRPDLSFELTNLQTLCASCHARKTRAEIGLPQLSTERRKWRDFLEVSPDVTVCKTPTPPV